MRGPDALVELSGALCTFWAAVYEATEARFLATLWRAAGEARSRRTPSQRAARCCSRCAWSVWYVGGLGGTIVIPAKLQWRLPLPDLWGSAVCARLAWVQSAVTSESMRLSLS